MLDLTALRTQVDASCGVEAQAVAKIQQADVATLAQAKADGQAAVDELVAKLKASSDALSPVVASS